MSKEQKIQKPEWFNVNNYNDASSFTKEQWFEQVALRFMLYSGSIDDENYQTFISHFEEMKKQKYPFVDSPESILIFTELLQKPTSSNRAMNIGDLFIDKNTNQSILPSLWSTTTSEVVKNFAALKNNDTEFNSIIEINNWHKENSKFSMSPVNKVRTRAIDDLFNADDILGRRHLTIDLNGTKTEIKKDFNKWLNQSKKDFHKEEERQKLTESKINILNEKKILAYLDLLIWCKLENIETGNHKQLFNSDLIEWLEILPDYSIDDIRKEVNHLVGRIMTFNTIIRLYKYAFGSLTQQQITSTIQRYAKKHNVNLKDIKNTTILQQELFLKKTPIIKI